MLAQSLSLPRHSAFNTLGLSFFIGTWGRGESSLGKPRVLIHGSGEHEGGTCPSEPQRETPSLVLSQVRGHGCLDKCELEAT